MVRSKKPKQNRGLETKQRILQAGFELFSQKGLHGTNSREIAATAGVSIGSFYTYYKDKRLLFMELIRSHCSKILKVLNNFSVEAYLEKDPREAVHTLIQSVWMLHTSVYPLNQKAIALREIDAEIDMIIREQEEAIVQRLVEILQGAESKLRIQDLETAAWLMDRLIIEVMHSDSRQKPIAERDRIVNQLVDMISRYLFKT